MLKRTFAALMLLVSSTVFAQNFTIVVPSAAGSFQDLAARHVADSISSAIGMPVVIDNKPGAHGLIAVQHFMSLPKDGNSAFLGSTVVPYVAKVHADQPFNPLTDLVPVHGISRTDVLVAVGATSGINSVADLIAKNKRDGSLRAGVAAPQSDFLIRELSKSIGVKVELIRYRQTPQMFVDLTNNSFDIVGSAAAGAGFGPMVTGGRIKPIAVFGSARSAAFPDVPTLGELGYKSVNDFAWSGLFVRTGTSQKTVEKIATAIKHAIANHGGKILPHDAAAGELAAQVKREYELIVVE